MRTIKEQLLAPAATILVLAALIPSVNAQVVSTSFQNGLNGYSGTLDRLISSDIGDETLGADAASYFLDGANNAGTSPDTQGLIRFDDIIGEASGQIPADATILSANLTLHTSVRGNAQTSGPYGVSGLLQKDDLFPFDETTAYEFFEANPDSEALSRGAWWQDGYATRPVGGYGFQLPGAQDSASVISVVQAWVDGTYDNHGFVVQAGRSDLVATAANTSDGWAIRTTGFPIADTRPKLEVEYTTQPIERNSFQDGANEYSGTTLAFVRSGENALFEDTDDLNNAERTEDGLDLDQSFLDGLQFDNIEGDVASPDDFVLLKFDGVFGADESQAPADVPVAKAWAVLTTGDQSNAAQSSGPWSAHTMLKPWDTTSLHSSFGEINGLQLEDGDISPALDTLDGFIRGAEVWFDVTGYLEGVRTGADDNGIAVLTKGTADGWLIHTNGSVTDTAGATDESARPRLVVYSGAVGVPFAAADCNGDGVVDATDLACVASISERNHVLTELNTVEGDLDGVGGVNFDDFVILANNFGMPEGAYSEGNIDLINGIDFDDFVLLSNNFGQGGTAAAVPEPGGLFMLALAGLLLLRVQRVVEFQ